jgi:hypothetical protein
MEEASRAAAASMAPSAGGYPAARFDEAFRAVAASMGPAGGRLWRADADVYAGHADAAYADVDGDAGHGQRVCFSSCDACNMR